MDAGASAAVGRGEAFRFSDLNEASGRPLAHELFRDLPGWAMDVVLAMGVTPSKWNELVGNRRVLEVPSLDGWHRVPRRIPARPAKLRRVGCLARSSRRSAVSAAVQAGCRGGGRCGGCRGRGAVPVTPEAVIQRPAGGAGMTASTYPGAAPSAANPAFAVAEVPERFRLSDENPLTWRSYANRSLMSCRRTCGLRSRRSWGVTLAAWNDSVRRGEVYRLPGSDRWSSLIRFLRSVRARGERVPSRRVCPDCWGTLAVLDTDRLVTGRRGGVFLCVCAR